MKLSGLLEKIDCLQIIGDLDKEIVSVEYDSRKVKEGSLFVCLKGFQSDGHDFAQMAVDKGAVALLVEDMPEFETNAVIVQVKNSRRALAYLAAAWFDYPAEKLTVIGLTGTKGKTTTSFMVKKILEQAGNKVGLIGTTGAYVGEKKIETKNTTPESFELHALFDRMVKNGCKYVVMEASSQGFKLERTAGVMFDYGAFLNLSPDHISPGEHESFEEYKDCKKMMFAQTKQAIINKDADYWEEFAKAAEEAKQPILVSTKEQADLTASNIKNIWEPGLFGTTFTSAGLYEGEVVLSMPGAFNVANALIAMSICASIGIAFDTVKEALKNVAVKGRAQVLPVPAKKGTFIIDYAHNALSMESILHMLSEYQPQRLICLFGGGGNRPKQRRYDMGLIAGKYADLTIITTDNPRFEAPEVINEHIIEGLRVHEGEYKIIMDRAEAIRYLLESCTEKDLVVMVGKGHEEYQEIRGVKYFFSEEKVVLDYLEENI